jgi:four helix bundle protein
MIKSYKDLEVYQKSYQTALELHQMTLEFPRHELYELGSQMRRAATSIPLNIAEGYGRKSSSNEFKQFLRIALGSCNEVNVLIEMLRDLGYMEETKYQEFYEKYDHLSRQI